jgi:hypothetical protein
VVDPRFLAIENPAENDTAALAGGPESSKVRESPNT